MTEEVFGCRRGRNAEQMMIQIAMDLESPAFAAHDYVTGVAGEVVITESRKPFQLCMMVYGEPLSFMVPWEIGGGRATAWYKVMPSL